MVKYSDPMIWGAWGGIGAALMAIAALMAGHALGGTVFGYGAGGFFWLWVAANVKNRIGGLHG